MSWFNSMNFFPRSLLCIVPVALATFGCAGVNNAMIQANASLAAANRNLSGASGVNVDSALAKPPAPLASDVASAVPMIKDFVSTSACLSKNANVVNILSRFWDGTGHGIGYTDPKSRMGYNQSRCLKVDRVGAWSQPAKNVLSFTVTYLSESSGESVILRHTIHRDESGKWYLSGY